MKFGTCCVQRPTHQAAGGYRLNYFLRGSLVIDPIQKFDKPLTINPKQDFLILWIILRKFLIAATKNGANVYPNLTVD
jgi:hypothetical protein